MRKLFYILAFTHFEFDKETFLQSIAAGVWKVQGIVKARMTDIKESAEVPILVKGFRLGVSVAGESILAILTFMTCCMTKSWQKWLTHVHCH